mmetsp:Transcript_102685/g.290197  ORF Transcript_102685/g.290197 Transcript_102685/m.290197 type:complete len:394 (+) Transcript_102685:669-1850(+)
MQPQYCRSQFHRALDQFEQFVGLGGADLRRTLLGFRLQWRVGGQPVAWLRASLQESASACARYADPAHHVVEKRSPFDAAQARRVLDVWALQDFEDLANLRSSVGFRVLDLVHVGYTDGLHASVILLHHAQETKAANAIGFGAGQVLEDETCVLDRDVEALDFGDETAEGVLRDRGLPCGELVEGRIQADFLLLRVLKDQVPNIFQPAIDDLLALGDDIGDEDLAPLLDGVDPRLQLRKLQLNIGERLGLRFVFTSFLELLLDRIPSSGHVGVYCLRKRFRLLLRGLGFLCRLQRVRLYNGSQWRDNVFHFCQLGLCGGHLIIGDLEDGIRRSLLRQILLGFAVGLLTDGILFLGAHVLLPQLIQSSHCGRGPLPHHDEVILGLEKRGVFFRG